MLKTRRRAVMTSLRVNYGNKRKSQKKNKKKSQQSEHLIIETEIRKYRSVWSDWSDDRSIGKNAKHALIKCGEKSGGEVRSLQTWCQNLVFRKTCFSVCWLAWVVKCVCEVNRYSISSVVKVLLRLLGRDGWTQLSLTRHTNITFTQEENESFEETSGGGVAQ